MIKLTCIIVFVFLGHWVEAQAIKIHAPHAETYACTEHWEGQFKWAGDALGTDCIIQGWYKDDTRLFLTPFKNQGFVSQKVLSLHFHFLFSLKS